MTVSTSASSSIVRGNGVTTVFNFSFVCDTAAEFQVIYTNTIGSQTLLEPSQYTLFLNPVATNGLHHVGGTVTFPTSGSPIANGTYLTFSRVVPLTQQTSISNQGDFYPTVVEEALDQNVLQIQQVSARTGQIRGTWAGGIDYNFGDIVQDGSNGDNTLNYYQCAIANTSNTWATDLAAGDWSLAINIQQTAQYATDAAASAADAAASAITASNAASSATLSANSASDSADAADASATAAGVSAGSASTSAATATTQASTATTQAGNASTSASTASAAAITATTQAGLASTSATTATTQAGIATAAASAAAASATQAAGTLLGTSTSSNSVGTGAKTFTTQSGLVFGSGGFVTIASTISPANYIHGQVTSYSGTTLVINGLDIGGTGTFASWTITTSSPQGPPGIGAGTVSSGTAGQLTYYASTGDTASGNANATVSAGQLTLGVATSAQGSLRLSGSVSGTTTLAAPTTGTGTMTLQAGSDTIVGRATTDTFTNKTLTASTNTLGGVTVGFGSDATGDIYYRNSGGILTRLAIGTANQVLHGGTTPGYSAVVEGDLGLTDITTANVTSTKHGFVPKSSADATLFLNSAATPVFAAVKDSDLSTTDITTNNATSTKHGFSPKSPSDATQFLNGAATPAYAAVKDSDLSTSDITTNNATSSKHGFLPKLSNVATEYLNGTGAWSTPAGSTAFGAVGTSGIFQSNGSTSASGATRAGSNMRHTSFSSAATPVLAAGATTPSGTWRNMGEDISSNGFGLFVRTV